SRLRPRHGAKPGRARPGPVAGAVPGTRRPVRLPGGNSMRNNVEDVVRDSLRELTDAPPPSGLAAAALRRANRQRATRYGLTGVAALGLLALAVPLALATARPGRTTTAGAPPPAASGSLVVVAYSGAAAGGVKDPNKPDDDVLPGNGARKKSLLLNRKTGKYDTVPYVTAVPSPDGSRA